MRAGLPVTVGGMTVNRFCSSGLQTIALAAQRIIAGEASVIAAGGLESISLVQDGKTPPAPSEWMLEHKPDALHADDRYRRQRRRALQGEPRSAGRLRAGEPAPHRDGAAGESRFDGEIVPLPTTKKVVDKDTKAESFEPVTLKSDEGNRPDTTLEGLAALKPVREGKLHHRRQRQPAFRRRFGLRGHGRKARRTARPQAARHLPRLRRRRLRARRDGHRPGLRRAEAARPPRPEGRATSICGS